MVNPLKIKIFADGADLNGIKQAATDPKIKGFTTNPTLMKSAGITDYKKFALDVLAVVPTLPVSFEVFADDFGGTREGYQAVPLGAILPVAVLIFVALVGGESELGDGGALRGVTHLGIFAEIADENDFVHAFRHGDASGSV